MRFKVGLNGLFRGYLFSYSQKSNENERIAYSKGHLRLFTQVLVTASTGLRMRKD